MKAIILAAGRGSRMGAGTDNLPKCRTLLHGKSLIQWQLDALRSAGIHDISIVRGYLAESFDFDLHYFDNPRWSETNMVLSLAAAEPWLREDSCIISYSDIVYSADSVARLRESDGDIVITYDPSWRQLWELRFDDPLSDAETFRLQGDRVVEIGGRANTIEEIEGQYMGLLKFTPKGWSAMSSFLRRHSSEVQDRMDMTTLLRGAIENGIELLSVPIEDRWYEVDTDSDRQKYEALPALFESTGER